MPSHLHDLSASWALYFGTAGDIAVVPTSTFSATPFAHQRTLILTMVSIHLEDFGQIWDFVFKMGGPHDELNSGMIYI